MTTHARAGSNWLGVRRNPGWAEGLRIRRNPTLGLRSATLLRLVIRASQKTRFGASLTPQTFELLRQDESLASGEREYEDGPAFFAHFYHAFRPQDLRGLDVLDLGCGYGGRTVYYARDCGARHVSGIEISANMVHRCELLAQRMATRNTSFEVAFAEALPYADESFDAVVSYDVLEHVTDPFQALSEVARVLRPGGHAGIVFPTYLGARSSHLDYITRIPLLHRIFDPYTVVSVVNEFLIAQPERFGTRPQPAPEVSSLGVLSLPTLNGLTLPLARKAVRQSGLELAFEAVTPIVTDQIPVPGARFAAAALRLISRVRLPEVAIGNIAFILLKPTSQAPE